MGHIIFAMDRQEVHKEFATISPVDAMPKKCCVPLSRCFVWSGKPQNQGHRFVLKEHCQDPCRKEWLARQLQEGRNTSDRNNRALELLWEGFYRFLSIEGQSVMG